jgi:hypothetical protein
MKAHGGVGVWFHIFLTSALVGGEWSASRPAGFTPGKRAPGTHWIGGRNAYKILEQNLKERDHYGRMMGRNKV